MKKLLPSFEKATMSFKRHVTPPETVIQVPQPIRHSGNIVSVPKTYFVDGDYKTLKCDRVSIKMPEIPLDLAEKYKLSSDFIRLLEDIKTVEVIPPEENSDKNNELDTLGLLDTFRKTYVIFFTGDHVTFSLGLVVDFNDAGDLPKPKFSVRCWVDTKPLNPSLTRNEAKFMLHLTVIADRDRLEKMIGEEIDHGSNLSNVMTTYIREDDYVVNFRYRPL